MWRCGNTSISHNVSLSCYTKFGGKLATSVTGRGGPSVCETSRIPHFLDILLTDGSKFVSVTRGPSFTPEIFLVLISFRAGVNPSATVRLEGLGRL
jgi:hypothetical protein